MDKLEKAYYTLQDMELQTDVTPTIDVRFNILTSILFLMVMLSVPLGQLSMLIWFSLYPIITSAIFSLSFGRIFKHSLVVLPFVVLIGLFNPIYDREAAINIGSVVITEGWISFISIILRGLLAMQVILILIESCGFLGICRGLRQMWVPSFLTDQLQFVYRYISVMLLEALSMRRAREARGFGRKRYPIKLWGVMIGQLFLRSIDRADRINRAMLARGFNGTLPNFASGSRSLRFSDFLFLGIAIAALAAMRIWNLSSLFHLNSLM